MNESGAGNDISALLYRREIYEFTKEYSYGRLAWADGTS